MDGWMDIHIIATRYVQYANVMYLKIYIAPLQGIYSAALIGVNPGGLRGCDPQILGRGVRGVVVSWTGRKIYILSCTGSIFESNEFRRETE